MVLLIYGIVSGSALNLSVYTSLETYQNLPIAEKWKTLMQYEKV